MTTLTIEDIPKIYNDPKYKNLISQNIDKNLYLLDDLIKNMPNDSLNNAIERIKNVAMIRAPQIIEPIIELLTWLKADEEIKNLSNNSLSLRENKDIGQKGYDLFLQCGAAVDEFHSWLNQGLASMENGEILKQALIDNYNTDGKDDQILKSISEILNKNISKEQSRLHIRVQEALQENSEFQNSIYSNIHDIKSKIYSFLVETNQKLAQSFKEMNDAFDEGHPSIQEPFKKFVFILTLDSLIGRETNGENSLSDYTEGDLLMSTVNEIYTILAPIRSNQEQNNIEGEIYCCICLEEKPNAYFSPCAHNQMCFQCSSDLKICPICRTEGFSKLRISQEGE